MAWPPYFYFMIMLNVNAMVHAFTLKEMFITFPVEKLKMTKALCKKNFKDGDKRTFAIQIFRKSLEYILEDIITKGMQFQFPSYRKTTAYLGLQKITGDEYRKLRKRGAYRNLDPVVTNFTTYRVEYTVERDLNIISRVVVHFTKKYQDMLDRTILQGNIKVGKLKTYQDYFDIMEQTYPDIDRTDIIRIMHFGFNQLRLHMAYGGDVLIKGWPDSMYIGRIYSNHDLHWEYVADKLVTKIRVLYRRLHYAWDGYSYFSLTDSRYQAIINDFNKGNTIDFGKVMLHRVYDEGFFRAYRQKALFRVKDTFDSQSRFSHMEHLITDKAELVEVFNHWGADKFSTVQHNFLTLVPYPKSVQKIYNDNMKPWITRLRAERWKKLHK